MTMGADPRGFRLRPLEIGDVLDGTFQIYKRQFVTFITVMGLVIVPTSVLSVIAGIAAGVGGSMAEELSSGLAAGLGITAVALIIVLAIVASLAQVVAGGAATLIASSAILGQPITIGDAYRQSFSKLGSLLLASLVVSIPLMLLVVTCIGIPVAVYIGLGWALLFPVIILERQGAIDGLRRSWHLVSGHRWRLLACSLLIGLLTAILVSIPSGLFAMVAGIVVALSGGGLAATIAMQIGNAFFQALGQTLFGAITYILMTLLYYDLRVRKEAFDLEQRAYQAEPGAPQWQQPPAGQWQQPAAPAPWQQPQPDPWQRPSPPPAGPGTAGGPGIPPPPPPTIPRPPL
jgi:hypothetical protein